MKAYLDGLVARYERPAFIAADPVALPHAFDAPEDREVIGLFAALLAWGRRATVLSKLAELVERMGHRPHRFVRDFRPGRDADRLAGFRHRTFQPADAVGLVLALQAALDAYGSLGRLFAAHLPPDAPDVGPAIQGFSETLLTIGPAAPRAKHLARPSTGSACKRLAMYARWMVRPGPVDLGLWADVSPARLVLPLDVHTGRQARRLGLLDRRQDDWRAVLQLTTRLRAFCPDDPARYDFALFGLGAYEGRTMNDER
ncbi:MAG TPA: TIGR02757 family protein [Rubricoccaceae bacterium]|nr:TIGR02757 family protein [Rubricoccaceae bacterium]